jgi:hypothetical protein
MAGRAPACPAGGVSCRLGCEDVNGGRDDAAHKDSDCMRSVRDSRRAWAVAFVYGVWTVVKHYDRQPGHDPKPSHDRDPDNGFLGTG